MIDARALDDLIDELAALPAAERSSVRASSTRAPTSSSPARSSCTPCSRPAASSARGHRGRPARGRVLRTLPRRGDPPLFDDVRRSSILNLAARYHVDPAHTEHVARLALGLFDELAPPACTPATRERELLWAACVLHDIGMSVDYDDHHKHSRYLILNAGLPGFEPREVALIAQAARYHRKGMPDFRALLADRATATTERLDRMRDAAAPRRGSRAQPRPDRARGRTSPRRRQVRLELDADGDAASSAGPPAARPSSSTARSTAADGLTARLSSARSVTSGSRSPRAGPHPRGPLAARPGPTGISSGSTGALIASASSISSSGGSMPSHIRRNAPVPTFASPSSRGRRWCRPPPTASA